MAKCECFVKVGENMESRIKEKLPEGASLRSSGWKQSGLFMKGGIMSVGHYIEYNATYQETKKDGTPKARLTKQDFPIVFSFCPFCGCSFADPDPYEFPVLVKVVKGYDRIGVDGSRLQLLTVADRNEAGHVFATYRNILTGEEITFNELTIKARIDSGDYKAVE